MLRCAEHLYESDSLIGLTLHRSTRYTRFSTQEGINAAVLSPKVCLCLARQGAPDQPSPLNHIRIATKTMANRFTNAIVDNAPN